MSNTSLRAYSINNADEFSNYLETLDNTDGLVYSGNGKIVIESECAPAMMLAESLAEFGIVTPLMEADDLEETLREEEEARELEEKKKAQAAAQQSQENAQVKEDGQPTQEQKPEEKKEEGPAPEQKNDDKPAEQQGETTGEDKKDGDAQLNDVNSPAADGEEANTQEQGNKAEGQNQEGGNQSPEQGTGETTDAGGESVGASNTEQEQGEETTGNNGIPEVTQLPEAFNVEPDDSEWDNAVITGYGFPMVNFSSQLVQDMLRAADPKSQKRSYKEFKKQLKKNPDIANALGLGLGGTLGLRSGKKGAKSAGSGKDNVRIQTDSNNSEADVLVEGPIDAISKAFSNPIELLKKIAKPKGAPCKRNVLVINHNEIADKSGDSDDDVQVIPLGVSGGVFVDVNKSVNVPVVHLTTFYSVVDPNASYKSYVKAMAEVNEKTANADMGKLDTLKSAAKNLKSKIPILGKKAKQEIEAKQKEGMAAAMDQLSKYIKGHGHPPFYLLKAKSNPKENDRWSDEDAAHGYQMIALNIGGRKAGMFIKSSTAEALFHVG